MPSKTERVLQAILAMWVAALPDADVKRNEDKPARIAPGGNVIVHDGDPGDPEILLSPYRESYEHQVEVDVAAYESASKTREIVVDEMVEAFRQAVAGDRTLGGLCDWVAAPRPSTDDAAPPGVEPIRWARFVVTCAYTD